MFHDILCFKYVYVMIYYVLNMLYPFAARFLPCFTRFTHALLMLYSRCTGFTAGEKRKPLRSATPYIARFSRAFLTLYSCFTHALLQVKQPRRSEARQRALLALYSRCTHALLALLQVRLPRRSAARYIARFTRAFLTLYSTFTVFAGQRKNSGGCEGCNP